MGSVVASQNPRNHCLKRSLVLYRRDPDASDGPGNVRSYLARRFRELIAGMARDDHLRPLREGGLSETDIALFKAVYAEMVVADRPVCDYEVVLQLGGHLGLNQGEVIDATQMLADHDLWSASAIMSETRYAEVEATTLGMEYYCKSSQLDYQLLITEVQKRIHEGVSSSGEISRSELASVVGKPNIVIGLDCTP
jgi:hypothetical protein